MLSSDANFSQFEKEPDSYVLRCFSEGSERKVKIEHKNLWTLIKAKVLFKNEYDLSNIIGVLNGADLLEREKEVLRRRIKINKYLSKHSDKKDIDIQGIFNSIVGEKEVAEKVKDNKGSDQQVINKENVKLDNIAPNQKERTINNGIRNNQEERRGDKVKNKSDNLVSLGEGTKNNLGSEREVLIPLTLNKQGNQIQQSVEVLIPLNKDKQGNQGQREVKVGIPLNEQPGKKKKKERQIYDRQLILNLGRRKSEEETTAHAMQLRGEKKGIPSTIIDLHDFDVDNPSEELINALKELTHHSRVYIIGHGSPGGEEISSADGNNSINYKQICDLLGKYSEKLKEQDEKREITISNVICNSAKKGTKQQKSISHKESEYLYKTYRIFSRIYGRDGRVARLKDSNKPLYEQTEKFVEDSQTGEWEHQKIGKKRVFTRKKEDPKVTVIQDYVYTNSMFDQYRAYQNRQEERMDKPVSERLEANKKDAIEQQANESPKGFKVKKGNAPTEVKLKVEEINVPPKVIDVPIKGKEKNIKGDLVGIASSQGRRPDMEDADIAKLKLFKVKNRSYQFEIFGVFDGHGGANASVFVKKNITQYLKDALESNNQDALTDEGIFTAIKNCFINLDKDYEGNDGTTATVAIVLNGKIWVANVGDARTILVNKDGKATQASEDAKPNMDKYQKSIEKLGGMVIMNRVNMKLAVARAVGDKNIKGKDGKCCISPNPKITCFPLEDFKGGHLVLACDGLYDVATTNEVGQAISEMAGRNESAACMSRKLVYQAINSGSQDNVSAIVVKL